MTEDSDLSVPEAMAALEHFVIDNDELFELEERIGRFNIFDALGVARVEIRHSNFLAWLLDPYESHGQGDLFVRALLMDLLRQTPPASRPLNPVHLDGIDLREVEIRREWRNIDLLILVGDPQLVVMIENKIGSGEGDGQLNRYAAVCAAEFPGVTPLRVFLTVDGDDPSEDGWIAYSYGDVHRVFSRVRKLNAGAIGGDVDSFLSHYLRLLEGRFMNDEHIEDLCRRIYQNHRPALDLIFERVVRAGHSGLVGSVVDWLRSDPNRWHVFNVTGKRIDFVPKPWLAWIPPLCARPHQDPKWWVRFYLYFRDNYGQLVFQIAPCKDLALRERLIARLTQDPAEFDLGGRSKQTNQWTRLYSKKFIRFSDEEPPDAEEVIKKAAAVLDALMKQLVGMESAAIQVVSGSARA